MNACLNVLHALVCCNLTVKPIKARVDAVLTLYLFLPSTCFEKTECVNKKLRHAGSWLHHLSSG